MIHSSTLNMLNHTCSKTTHTWSFIERK